MATETYTISSSTFGFIIGGITLLGLLINYCRFHLPSNKIKVLESLLDETETFFRKAVEAGLLTEPNFVTETERHLELLKRRTCDLQASAYSATTLSKDYAEFFRGTSAGIGMACQSLKRLRAEVISSSEEGRRRAMEEDSASRPHATLPGPPFSPEPANHPTQSPAAGIMRPRSCPPSFSARSTDDRPKCHYCSQCPRADPFDGRTRMYDQQTYKTARQQIIYSTSVNPKLEA